MTYLSEQLERSALQAVHALADDDLRRDLQLELAPLADGVASLAAGLPASAIVINRALGIGLGRPVETQDVVSLAELYAAKGVSRFFLQVHPDARSEALTAGCAAAGLERARGWQKFVRGRDEAIPQIATDLRVREIGPEHGSDFARIVCDAFDLGDAAVPWLARLPGRNGWHAFMAFDGDRPAGAGALFMRGGAAWTDFGATAPAYRGRGAQGASLAFRVRFALERGCDSIHTCTGEEVEGDPQHSYSNIKRCGFRESYVRENYAPPKTP